MPYKGIEDKSLFPDATFDDSGFWPDHITCDDDNHHNAYWEIVGPTIDGRKRGNWYACKEHLDYICRSFLDSHRDLASQEFTVKKLPQEE